MDTIYGIVGRVAHRDEDKGTQLLVIEHETPSGLKTSKMWCNARHLSPGDAFCATVNWKINTHMGREENVASAVSLRPDLPRTEPGIERFLRGFLSKKTHGITDESIARGLQRHGANLLSAALENPEVLVSLSSEPPRFRSAILASWGKYSSGRRAVSLMQDCGLDEGAIARIVSTFVEDVYSSIRRNPYEVAKIPKVGFTTADKLGRGLGIRPDDRRRLLSALTEVVLKHEQEGSTSVDIEAIVQEVGGVSGLTDHSFWVDFLSRESHQTDHDLAIHSMEDGIYVSRFSIYACEASITNDLQRLVHRGRRNSSQAVQRQAEDLFSKPEYSKFDAVQRLAVAMAATEPVSIVTGGPGTGKSTVMDLVAQMSKSLDAGPLYLVAPTGKASKRLAETTGLQTSTVHRLLRAIGGADDGKTKFRVNRTSPLPPRSVVIVDEASMMDVDATAGLLAALPDDGRIILVGDRYQLPSVGPGSVLADLLAAQSDTGQVVPSVGLVNVYRSGKDSGIAKGAALLRDGILPDLGPLDRNGVRFEEVDEDRVPQRIEELYCDELPRRGLQSIRDVSVLCPQAPGIAGTWDLNSRIRERLNPGGDKIPGLIVTSDDDKRLPVPRVGDRIMLTANDKENQLVNGELGFITGVGRDEKGKSIINLEFDDGTKVNYPVWKWRSLILAYAGTVHKAQGSQSKVVLMPIVPSHLAMLDRTLVYTGWTRGQSEVALVGSMDVLRKSLKRWSAAGRATRLKALIEEAIPHRPAARPDWDMKLAEAEMVAGKPEAQPRTHPSLVLAGFRMGGPALNLNPAPARSRASAPAAVAPGPGMAGPQMRLPKLTALPSIQPLPSGGPGSAKGVEEMKKAIPHTPAGPRPKLPGLFLAPKLPAIMTPPIQEAGKRCASTGQEPAQPGNKPAARPHGLMLPKLSFPAPRLPKVGTSRNSSEEEVAPGRQF